jgi:hypothetical protein
LDDLYLFAFGHNGGSHCLRQQRHTVRQNINLVTSRIMGGQQLKLCCNALLHCSTGTLTLQYVIPTYLPRYRVF